jgi:hypothetical protein
MTKPVAAIASIATLLAGQTLAEDWKQTLDSELPLLGHRNWVAVVDSAYPLQTSPGIKTIYTGAEQMEVVRYVLNTVDKAKHVAPIVYTDAELKCVPADLAKGIAEYRAELKTVLKDHKVHSLPHGDIIAKLDEAGSTFRVLVLKTTLTLPYTSVFLELDCGYWGPEQEGKLREAMAAEN